MAFFSYLASFLSTLTPMALLAVGLYLGVRLRFFPFFHPVRVLRSLFGRRGAERASSLRAMGMALGGTIGVGNMAGVAMAILLGGAGAVFWMWVCAFAAMLLKYAEITLAMDGRRKCGKDFRGGTPYALADTGHARLGGLFALLCLGNALVLGGAVQANAAAAALADTAGLSPAITGAALVFLTLPVILGGTRRIAGITARIVPFMCFLYIGGGVLVLLLHAPALPGVFVRIFTDAFSPLAAGGGVFGFFTSAALRQGAARGLMSNEGGCGTAPLAHITSEEKDPARQGLFGIVEVFVDTVLICTLTAFVILCVFPELPSGVGGMALTRAAFTASLGAPGGILVTASLLLFAYATVLCEVFYGRACLAYFTEDRRAALVYAALFLGALFFGAVLPTGSVWYVSDLLLSLMTLLNLALLSVRAGHIVRLTRRSGLLR